MFEKYQKLLLKIANNPLGRAYLGLKDALVVKVTKNSVHYLTGFNKKSPKVTAHFFSSNTFAKKLNLIFSSLSVYENYSEVLSRIDYLLPAIIDKVHLSGIVVGAVTSFNSNANPETTSFDGWTGFDYNNTEYSGWAAHRGATTSGASSFFLNDSGTAMVVSVADPNSANKFQIERSFMLFDTSSLTAGATISSAAWHWQYSSIVVDSEAGSWVSKLYLTTSSPASNTAIAVEDFDQIQFTAQATAQTSLAAKSINTDYSFALNATGLGNISKTGITKFGLSHGNDFENIDPNTASGQTTRLQIYTSDYTAVPSRVHYLEITYTPAPGGGSPIFFGNTAIA